jgi:hypothetical protein
VLRDRDDKHLTSRALLKGEDPALLAKSLLREIGEAESFHRPIKLPEPGDRVRSSPVPFMNVSPRFCGARLRRSCLVSSASAAAFHSSAKLYPDVSLPWLVSVLSGIGAVPREPIEYAYDVHGIILSH